ncbi:MAG: hypothetical protein Q9227_000643 [Pyrenula ochraceoflavens]
MLLFSISNANAIIAYIPQINQSLDTARQLLRLSRLPFQASHEHKGEIKISNIGDIRLNNLSFSYPSRQKMPALRNLDLIIPANHCTALVGQSGSGKSTVASILLGLYPTSSTWHDNSSAATVGGVDICELHIPTLRSLIGVVSQNPTLFPATVLENITYGLDPCSSLVSMENISMAMKAASIEEYVLSLPNGLETAIGEGGIGLSTGQAQRVVIARALCRRPKLLILDEATSTLDSDNAEIVKQTVTDLMRQSNDLTVLIITHAKEMMEVADNVLVLEKGSLAQQGTYEHLSNVDGPLKEILKAGDAAG